MSPDPWERHRPGVAAWTFSGDRGSGRALGPLSVPRDPLPGERAGRFPQLHHPEKRDPGEADTFYAFHPGPVPSTVARPRPGRLGLLAVPSVEERHCPDLLFQDADSLERPQIHQADPGNLGQARSFTFKGRRGGQPLP